MPASRLGRQIAEVVAALNAIGARFELIGGLALASHKVVRATQDVDFLADADQADAIDAELVKLGYRGLEDIRALLRANRANLDMKELRGYFRLFDREALLDDLLREAG